MVQASFRKSFITSKEVSIDMLWFLPPLKSRVQE